MKVRHILYAGCAIIILGTGIAHAGPCNLANANKDAGSGPTPGHSSQTVGTATAPGTQHPPTDTMNRATGDTAASSQDAQKQMQNQPTASQEAQGAKSKTGADDDC